MASVGGGYNPPNSGGGTLSLPSSQPVSAGFWLDGGVLTFFNGTDNSVVDFNEGTPSSRFGTPLPGDI